MQWPSFRQAGSQMAKDNTNALKLHKTTHKETPGETDCWPGLTRLTVGVGVSWFAATGVGCCALHVSAAGVTAHSWENR